ncbi:hypothetical protein JW960_09685 [candidate division KSB1 bacterium]|nr:hypothetical protein [candidate division KSB1 bacterium]
MNIETGISSLVELGFTRLEAEIYTYLLQQPQATGYKIAQAIHKPTANTYKAIQSLQQKGAIFVEDADTRICRPVPVAELLSQLERRFIDKKETAESTLASLQFDDDDDRVYQLKTTDQVIERCRHMLQAVESILVIDAFPSILELLKPDIETVASQGVKVAINAYESLQIANTKIFERPNGQKIINGWPGEWINIIVDGDQFLIALFERGLKNVIQAIWSGSPYITWVYYSALMAQFQLSAIQQKLQTATHLGEIKDLLRANEAFFPLNASGYQKLIKRFKQFGDSSNEQID